MSQTAVRTLLGLLLAPFSVACWGLAALVLAAMRQDLAADIPLSAAVAMCLIFAGGCTLVAIAKAREPRRWVRAAGPSLVVALAAAALAMTAAWKHNPQSEFHVDGRVFWRPWLAIGGSWFVLVYAFSIAVIRGGVALASTVRKSAV